MKINHLSITWGVSKGRDTYGYNICRLDDRATGKRYRCMGGGYDMIGTVFGNWLSDVYQDRLKYLFDSRKHEDCGYGVKGYRKIPDLYGLTLSPSGVAQLDGACGKSSMQAVAEAIGLEVQWQGDRKGRTIGYFVQDTAVA